MEMTWNSYYFNNDYVIFVCVINRYLALNIVDGYIYMKYLFYSNVTDMKLKTYRMFYVTANSDFSISSLAFLGFTFF